MRVLVSTSVDANIGMYRVFSSVKDIDWSKVEAFIYHDCNDTEVDVVFALNAMPDTVAVKIYVNSNINPVLYTTFQRIHGVVYEDESLLEDTESLDYLVENAGTIGNEVQSASDNLGRLNKCIDAIKKADEVVVQQLINNKNWLETLNDVSQEMNNALVLDDKSNENMRAFLNVVQQDIQQLEASQDTTDAELAKLRKQIETMSTKDRALHAYGVYKLPVTTQPVLYIRCVGDVSYLTTFCEYFISTVKVRQHKQGRLLVIRPSTLVYKLQYRDYHTLEPDTVALYDATHTTDTCFVTYEPVKQVFDKFFSCPANFYIVIDYQQTGHNAISSGLPANFKPCIAYHSVGMYNRSEHPADIPRSRIFFPAIGLEGANILPYIEGFCTMDIETRKKALWTNTKNIVASLTTILGL